jgi:hypothetical protein
MPIRTAAGDALTPRMAFVIGMTLVEQRRMTMSIRDSLRPPKEFLAAIDRGPAPGIAKLPVKIPVPASSLPPRKQPGIAATPPGPVQPLIALIGTLVVLHMRYGELVRGTLVRLYNYELVVRTSAGVDAIVMKRAIDWVEPAEEGAPQ